ncbi:MAG: class I SAM-dependent methyltransferase [Gemmatimonadetes bacterium]|nr:class I SAM-dependent methyltransferase [Gemmatimonadota bacterium]
MTHARLEEVGSCPVCGHAARRPHLTSREWIYGLPGTFTVVRCARCGHGYLSPRPVPEDVGRFYPEGAYYAYSARRPLALFARTAPVARAWYFLKKSALAHHHGYRALGGSPWLGRLLALPGLGPVRRRAAFDLGILLPPAVEGGTLLEIGCGSGAYLDLMRSLGWRTVGVEMSETAAAAARDSLSLDVRAGLFEDVALERQAFDAISTSHTLEHVYDPVAFLRKAHGLLRKGGRLAVVVPNSESVCATRFGAAWVGVDTPRHLQHFTAASLAAAARAAGFTRISVETPPWGAYQVALFSRARQVGDPPEVYNDDLHRFPPARRLGALGVAVRELGEVALGRPSGEVLALLAVP